MKGSQSGMPLWAQLRLAHGFARSDEVPYLQNLRTAESANALTACAPSGCETSGSHTGGCKTGTSCLLSGLQH
jgi:hypothetical protein